MEYSFQNGPREKKTSITLNEYDLVLESGLEWIKIAYPQITEVRLIRKRNFYSIQVSTLDNGTILITNGAFDSEGKWVDRSRQYQTFVRVLHMHLQNKCKASFYSGIGRLFHSAYLGIAIVTGLSVFILEEYFDMTPLSGILLSVVVFLVVTAGLLLPKISQWQKQYSPTDVPLNMLPPA